MKRWHSVSTAWCCSWVCAVYSICIVKVNRRDIWTLTLVQTCRATYFFNTSLQLCSKHNSVIVPCCSRLCNDKDVKSPDIFMFIRWHFSLSLSAGVWGAVTDPCAAGVLLPVQPAQSPPSRCLAAGTQAAHWPGEVSWRQCFIYTFISHTCVIITPSKVT